MTKTNFNWLLKMAWRDSRRNRGRLLLFISSIIIGIAALVAINSFGENLKKDIEREAKSLLGADLHLETTQIPPDSIRQLFDSLGGQQSRLTGFISMAYFPKTGNTRLAIVQALEGGYPFYGKISTQPPQAAGGFRNGKQALVDKAIMIQYGIQPGDSVKVGDLTFEIAGQVDAMPGRTGLTSSIAPVVIIPMSYLEETGLVQKGSRIEYSYYFKFDEEVNVEELVAKYRPRFREASIRDETVEERKENIGSSLENMTTFLQLVGFIALLLGCIGVASAVHIYIKDKIPTVAILRCLGASGRQAFLIYLLQILFMAFFGAVIGALGGSLLQLILPRVLGEFLPLAEVSTSFSGSSILQGIATGLGIALLFALLPLLSIRRISPLRAIRLSVEEEKGKRDPLRWLVYFLIFLFISGFTYLQTSGGLEAFSFPLAIGLGFLILAGVARLAMWLVKKFFPRSWSYIWRQSLANLYRPNNQTLILIISIGLGSSLIATLFFTRDLLLDQVELSGGGSRPNMILFDIQTPQKEAIATLAGQHGLPLVQQVPIVTMRLNSIEGHSRAMRLKDSLSSIPIWVYNREYRVTYRDTLIDSETISEGIWHAEKEDDGTIYVSIAENIADNMKAKIGAQLTFNVQGREIETEVSSIRKVDFNRVQTNFFVVFPAGILEKAPQFHVVITRTESPEQSAVFQQALVKQFPNVTVIDLAHILRTIDEVLGKVSFVIQFMALFSILTGLVVLISSVLLSKYQRIRESVLLRTLGASRRQILSINALEYLLLGSLATLTGLFISVVSSWLLAVFMFEIPFTPNWLPAIISVLIITSLTVMIGLFNSREVLNKPPLEVLRKEGGG